jgi:hypothetical protein
VAGVCGAGVCSAGFYSAWIKSKIAAPKGGWFSRSGVFSFSVFRLHYAQCGELPIRDALPGRQSFADGECFYLLEYTKIE